MLDEFARYWYLTQPLWQVIMKKSKDEIIKFLDDFFKENNIEAIATNEHSIYLADARDGNAGFIADIEDERE